MNDKKDTKAVTPWYLDKALLLLITTPFFAIVSKWLGIDLNAETLLGLILPVITYIITHKWKSAKITIAEIEAQAKKDTIEKAPTVPPPAVTSLKGILHG